MERALTSRWDFAVDWWQMNSGAYFDDGLILPYVVLHGTPDPSGSAPTPVMVGPASLQRCRFGITTPDEFRSILKDQMPPEYSRGVFLEHLRTVQSWEPQQKVGRFSGTVNGIKEEFDYRRILFPVRLKNGSVAVATLSEEIRIH